VAVIAEGRMIVLSYDYVPLADVDLKSVVNLIRVENHNLVAISTQVEMFVFVSKTSKKLYSALQLIVSQNKGLWELLVAASDQKYWLNGMLNLREIYKETYKEIIRHKMKKELKSLLYKEKEKAIKGRFLDTISEDEHELDDKDGLKRNIAAEHSDQEQDKF